MSNEEGPPVVIHDIRALTDMGRKAWDTIVTATQLYELHRSGRLRIDPDRQRGRDSVTGAEIFKKARQDIQNPATLKRLIVDLIEPVSWTSMQADVKGDIYRACSRSPRRSHRKAPASISPPASSSRRSWT